MKTAFINAKVYVDKGVYSQAVLISGGVIEKVGTTEEIMVEVSKLNENSADASAVEIIDCEGRTLIPGLNDSHMHFMQFGESISEAKIDTCRSIDELIQVCREYAETHPEVKKRGLHAIGWNQDFFVDSDRIPDRHDLDKISTEYPISLERVCGHIMSVNTRVIELLGLDADSPQYPEGLFHKDEETGYPTGVFKGNACNFARDTVAEYTLEDRKRIMIDTMDYLAEHGLTSIQSNDVGTTVSDGPGVFRIIHEIYDEGKGKCRYRHQVCFNDLEQFRKYLEDGEFVHGDYPKDSWLQLGPLKLFKDGSLGARTACMKNGYEGTPDYSGQEWLSTEEMDKYVKLASEHGVQVVTHCIGDGAVSRTMDSYEKGFVNGENKLRHTLVHCQITDREDLDRIRDKGILVAAQPVFIDYDMKIVEKLCGKKLAETSYNFGTMLREGVHLSYGTDCPVEDCNPFPNIYMAVTRKGREGKPEGGFYPEQCVDVETAIDAYTVESAYMEFQEDVKGRIKPGFLADVVLLDRDIFTCDPMEIKDILPVLTMVGGEVVYRTL